MGGNHMICMIFQTFPGLDLYCTDPAHVISVGIGSSWSR